jgi:hypothetical protein
VLGIWDLDEQAKASASNERKTEIRAERGLDPNVALAWVACLDADDSGGLLEVPRTTAELVR